MTLRVMSGIALRGAFEATLLPAFKRATGMTPEISWNPTTLLLKAAQNGERADIIIVTDEAIDVLAKAGIIDSTTCLKIASGLLGIAVKKGTARPGIGTVADFTRTIAAARSVAYSQSGASGLYFTELIEKLGVAEGIRRKATVIPAGFTAEKLVSGEADLAVQQISELMVVDGIDIVGPFPAEIQSETPFTAALFRDCANRAAAEAFMSQLGTAEAKQAYTASGLAAR